MLINEFDKAPRDNILDSEEFSDMILPYYYENTINNSPKRGGK